MHYYKTKDGKGLFSFITELSEEELQEKNYDVITEEQFNELNNQNFSIPENPNQQIYDQINQLKHNLSQTDYIALKLAEALADDNQSLINQIKTDYATELNNRKVWRARINELEAQLN